MYRGKFAASEFQGQVHARLTVFGLSTAECMPLLEGFVAFVGVHVSPPGMTQAAEAAQGAEFATENCHDVPRNAPSGVQDEECQQDRRVEQKCEIRGRLQYCSARSWPSVESALIRGRLLFIGFPIRLLPSSPFARITCSAFRRPPPPLRKSFASCSSCLALLLLLLFGILRSGTILERRSMLLSCR